MPELTEVFELVRNQIEFAPDAWEEQQRRQRRLARNRRIGAISLSAFLVAAAASAFVLGRSRSSDPVTETSRVAEQPTRSLSGRGLTLFDLETRQATRGASLVTILPAIAVSPDGTMVAYPGLDEYDQQVLYVADIDGTHVRALEETATTGAPVSPRFSPDGSQIVYQAKAHAALVGDLFLVDVGTGQTTRLTHLKPFASGLWAMRPTFSPDGETVLFTHPDANYSDQPANFDNQSFDVWSVPVMGGKPSLVLRDAIGGRLAPDGRTIVYFEPSPRNPFVGDMWLADADGTDARRLLQGDLLTLSAQWSPDGTKIAYADWGREGRGSTEVVDIATGTTSRILADSYLPEWVDDHTWIIGPPIH